MFVKYIYIYKMQRLEVSGAVRLIYRSLGVKGLTIFKPSFAATLLNPSHSISVFSFISMYE